MTIPNPAQAIGPGMLVRVGRTLRRQSASLCLSTSVSLLLLLPTLAAAQVGPTLKSLVTGRGSISVGDVTFTNFRTPFEWPMVFVDGPLVPDRGDRTAVSASVAADGHVDLIFTAIDALTGLRLPQVSATAVPNDYLAFVTYDVVVTDPGRALHAYSLAFGPATTGAVNAFGMAWTGPQNGALFSAQNWLGAYVAPLPNPPPALLYSTLATANIPALPADFRGARLGHQWWISAFRFGLGAIASADQLIVSLYTAPATPAAPGATPRIESLHADSVFLSAPAGPGGATLNLASSLPTQLLLPATVTVPAGASYVSWPQLSSNPSTFGRFVGVVTGTLGADQAQGLAIVYPDVWPPAAPVLPILNVVRLGTGNGSVGSNNGISCGSKCSASTQPGFVITFTAQPASGSIFGGWQGPCAGSLANTCNVTTTNADQVIVAVFDAVAKGGGGGGSTFTLSVGRSNPGTVTSDVGGLNCGSVCSAKFAQSSAVSLTATPPPGKAFIGWGGACSGTAPVCSLTVTSNSTVQANFGK